MVETQQWIVSSCIHRQKCIQLSVLVIIVSLASKSPLDPHEAGLVAIQMCSTTIDRLT